MSVIVIMWVTIWEFDLIAVYKIPEGVYASQEQGTGIDVTMIYF